VSLAVVEYERAQADLADAAGPARGGGRRAPIRRMIEDVAGHPQDERDGVT
jgi:hypothetical protein